METFLIFEQEAFTPHQPAPDEHYRVRGEIPPAQRTLHRYNVVGAVRAADAMEAVRAAMTITRRISKYAAVRCEVIDFAMDVSEAEGERAQLNP